MLLVYDHNYYLTYYNKYIYYKNFYKNNIFENINLFLKRIKKEKDILIQDDLDNENNEKKEKKSSGELINKQSDIFVTLAVVIDNINY